MGRKMGRRIFYGDYHAYPLGEISMDDKADYPEGRTLAVKRARTYSEGDITHILLGVLDADISHYVLGRTIRASGLAKTKVLVDVSSAGEVLNRRASHSHEVTAVHFAGRVLVPEVTNLQVVGAYVEGEKATGYIHIIDGLRVDELFGRQSEAVQA